MILKTKKCSRCGEIKPLSEFFKGKGYRAGYKSWCKICKLEYDREYRKNNREKVNQTLNNWRKNNHERHRENQNRWRKNNLEKAHYWENRYRENNRERIKERIKKWRSNPKNILSRRISSSIRQSLKENKNGRHWEELVGYTLKDLITHLEKQFKEGMSWRNIGKWHIDHKKPRSSFNFTSYDDEEFKECWALENLQPLWAEENLKKSNRARV